MSRAYSNILPWRLGRAGVTSLEFALVALAFLGVIFGCMDLGRYYLILHSLRTIASEAARAAQIDTTLNGCPISLTQSEPMASSGIGAMVPLLDPSELQVCVTQNPTQSQTLPVTVTVTATYQFAAFSPVWSSLTGAITEQATLSY